MPERFSIPSTIAARPGPPRLFDGEAASPEGLSLFGLDLLGVGVVIASICAAALIGRLVYRRAIGAERCAFRLLSKRLGLGPAERRAVERLADRQGVDPLGLLICESAFARASSGRWVGEDRITETKPVLLTGAEINELSRVSDRLFGRPAAEPLGVGNASEEDHEDDDSERTSRWVA